MADKKTCFVIMPFGDSKTRSRYDLLYTDAYKPGIEAGGLDAYRVDKDRKAREPVVAIHKKIQEAHVCFADISTDRPNIWYELGYAYALKKEVVLVCEKSRKSFPFDLGHRRRIPYSHRAANYLAKLKDEIEEEVRAVDKLVAETAGAAALSQDSKGKQLPEGWDKVDMRVLKCAATHHRFYGRPISITGVRSLATRTRISPRQLRASVEKLEKSSFIIRARASALSKTSDDAIRPTGMGLFFARKYGHLFD